MCVNVKVNVNVNLVFITFITHRNVIFDILEPAALRKYSTWWPSWPLWPSWPSYLISLIPMLFKKIAHVGSFKQFVFVSSIFQSEKKACELFHWIFCLISHCLWQIFIRLCSFHFFRHHSLSWVWRTHIMVWS